MTGPDFFIVGAPKCGTSALDEYLRAHPAIFMAPKERHFFGSDLEYQREEATPAEYFALFPPDGIFQARGDASVGYLYSKRAALEIHQYNPSARIIVMLRNPVDMMYSMHGQMLFSGAEDIPEFAEALGAEGERKKGRRIPPSNKNPWALQYRGVARYSEQVERYLRVFGRQQVHVILFDDFRADPGKEYRRVLRFLQIDQAFDPRYEVVNPHKRVRSEFVRHVSGALRVPPAPVLRVGKALLRSQKGRERLVQIRVWLSDALARANTQVTPRAPLDPGLRADLTREFAPDIRALARLLDRDLDHWLSPEQSPAAQGSS